MLKKLLRRIELDEYYPCLSHRERRVVNTIKNRLEEAIKNSFIMKKFLIELKKDRLKYKKLHYNFDYIYYCLEHIHLDDDEMNILTLFLLKKIIFSS